MAKKTKNALTRRAKRDSSVRQPAASTCAGCARIEYRLNTLIAWMAQSANSPIGIDDARKLVHEIGRP